AVNNKPLTRGPTIRQLVLGVREKLRYGKNRHRVIQNDLRAHVSFLTSPMGQKPRLHAAKLTTPANSERTTPSRASMASCNDRSASGGSISAFAITFSIAAPTWSQVHWLRANSNAFWR